jgi:Kef-type K+ transport system membrane component KefB
MHESIELQMSLLLAVSLAGHLLSSLLRQPAVVGQILAGLVVPWLAGYLLARGFGFETSSALLIGVALSATSIAVTADTLRELGRLQLFQIRRLRIDRPHDRSRIKRQHGHRHWHGATR